MSQSVSWFDLRDEAIRAFGGSVPHAQTENDVMELVQEIDSAAVVRRAIAEIQDGFQAGRIRSPWGVFRHKLKEAAATPSRNVQISTGAEDRETLVARSSTWMKTEGLFIESPEEMEHQLFGVPVMSASVDELHDIEFRLRGEVANFDQMGGGFLARMLHAQLARTREDGPQEIHAHKPLLGKYRDDLPLRRKMVELWLEWAPKGQQLEADAIARAEEWKAQQAKIKARRAQLEAVAA